LSRLSVMATSVEDPTKQASITVTIPAVPAAVETFTGYIINGSGTAFSATKGGAAVGAANQPIQTVIEAIRTNAAGSPAQIRFGNGSTALDIGDGSITFNNTGGTWGPITLNGKITGNISTTSSGIIVLGGGLTLTSAADVTNTAASNGIAIFNNAAGSTINITGGAISVTTSYGVYTNYSSVINVSGGTITATTGATLRTYTGATNVSGGTLTATTGYGVLCLSNGPINISGGTISVTSGQGIYTSSGWGKITITGGTIQATTGRAVNNTSYGSVDMSGGTLSATTGIALYNVIDGKITISGTAKLTSANTSASQGTVWFGFLSAIDKSTAVRLEMTGGTIENTSTTTGNAIRNDTDGALSISGGTVSKSGSGNYAIFSNRDGVVTIGGSAKVVGNKNK